MKKLMVAFAGVMAFAGFNAYGLSVNGIEVDPYEDKTENDSAAKWSYSANDMAFTFRTPGMVYVVEDADDLDPDNSQYGDAAVVIWDDEVVHRNVRKIAEHLYEIQYDDSGLLTAGGIMEGLSTLIAGGESASALSAGCTSCWNGDFVGRNFDWNWDDSNEYVVRMAETDDRHASIGMVAAGVLESTIAALMPDMDRELVLDYIGFWQWMPAITVDGINDAGVEINVNIVPAGSAGEITGTNPESPIDLLNIFVVRYVLDYASTPTEAVELLQAANIVGLPGMDTHWMIANSEECYIVEYVSSKLVVLKAKNRQAAMTNFHVSNSPHLGGYEVVANSECTANDFLPWSAGIERYDRATNGLAAVSSVLDMHDHMRENWFAMGFYLNSDSSNLGWWSENYGHTTGITDDMQRAAMLELTGVASVPFPGLADEYWNTGIKKTEQSGPEQRGWWLNFGINHEKELFQTCRTNEYATGSRRDPSTGKYPDLWQSVHSCSFDLENRELSVMVQECYVPFVFRLSGGYGDWPYADWKNPADFNDDIPATLKASGANGQYVNSINADGYAQLVRWAGSMGLNPSMIDNEVAEEGQNLLLCAALNKLHSFHDWDHAFSVPVTIERFVPDADSCGARLSISIDNGASIRDMNMNLFNASVSVLGASSPGGIFSSGDIHEVNCSPDYDNDRIDYTIGLTDQQDRYFYRVQSR